MGCCPSTATTAATSWPPPASWTASRAARRGARPAPGCGHAPRRGCRPLQPSLAAAILESFDIIEDQSPAFLECPSSLADRLLHNTAIEAAIGDLDLDMAGLLTRLQARNADDTAKLIGFQRADGGWGWCFSTEADPWLSAQALLVLTRAADLGYPVDDGVLTSAASYLRAQLDPVEPTGRRHRSQPAGVLPLRHGRSRRGHGGRRRRPGERAPRPARPVR
jgi:hypothetical protein